MSLWKGLLNFIAVTPGDTTEVSFTKQSRYSCIDWKGALLPCSVRGLIP